MDERREALIRVLVLIVTGIILSVWTMLVKVLVMFQWIVVLITDKRIEGVSDFCHIWNCQVYDFLKYITFKSNKRPFPFTKLAESD
jgi:sorbitol-specific phosphotransferase system component IIC